MDGYARRSLRKFWWLFVVAYLVIMLFTFAFQSIGLLMMLLALALAFLVTSKRLGAAWRMRSAATAIFILYLAAVATIALYAFALTAQPPTPLDAILVLTSYLAPLALAIVVLRELYAGTPGNNGASGEGAR